MLTSTFQMSINIATSGLASRVPIPYNVRYINSDPQSLPTVALYAVGGYPYRLAASEGGSHERKQA